MPCRCPAPQRLRRRCRSCSHRSRSTTTAAPATGARLPGRSCSSTTTTRRDLPHGRSARSRTGSLRRRRPSALPPSRRRRRVGQRGHARRARCAGNPRGAARGRPADAARHREQDHRVRRQFAVVAADQLGRIREPRRVPSTFCSNRPARRSTPFPTRRSNCSRTRRCTGRRCA